MEAVIAAGLALLAEVIKQIEVAQHAKDEEHADTIARMQASRAALAGDKSDAHKYVEDALAEAQAAIDAARAK